MRILYVQFTNPAGYPPLEHSSRILANAGWQVLFLGTGSLGTESLRFPDHPNIRVRYMSFCPAGWRQKLHYVRYFLWVLVTVLLWRPHWIYVSETLACPIASALTWVRKLRVAYHEHDSPGQAHGWFARVCLSARERLARRADICILPNQRRALLFAEQTGVPSAAVVCVWNCPTVEEVQERRAAFAADGVRLLYHGTVVPARLPLTVIAALAKMPPATRLVVVGHETVGHLGYLEQLRREAQRLGIEERLDLRAAVPRRELLLEICRTCDIGLAFMPIANTGDVNEDNMTGASNKPFDYLACGLAVLVSERPEWRQMFVDPAYGLACEPGFPESIVEALRWFAANPTEMRAMGEAGRQRIAAEWNYETQFAPVKARLDSTFVRR